MTPFTYERASTSDRAVQLGARRGAKYLGGGTNLVDLMREAVERPATVVDVSGLSRDIYEEADGSLTIGAGVTNTALAGDRRVRERYPLLSQAILSGASAQIRNMATIGGNILQRTRCAYFYDAAAHCNKRSPDSGCDAIGGFNRNHAILGASDACVATHPSDMGVALAALDAIVVVQSQTGATEIPFVSLHKLPGETPQIETVLEPGTLITAVRLRPNGISSRSSYRKVRDRASYAFALISLAAGLEMEGDVVKDVRLALGGVASKPWRAVAAEAVLRGRAITDAVLREAADAELSAAQGLKDNAFKIELARRVIVDSLSKLATTKRIIP